MLTNAPAVTRLRKPSRKPCGIAGVMHRAERAWRKELAATTIADLVETSGIGAVTRVRTWLATLPSAS